MTATAYDIATSRPDAAPEFSPRQQVVLQHALTLLVEGGEKALTTAGLARTASCSKESLYKWFGDRDGLLAAMVAYPSTQLMLTFAAMARLTRIPARPAGPRHTKKRRKRAHKTLLTQLRPSHSVWRPLNAHRRCIIKLALLHSPPTQAMPGRENEGYVLNSWIMHTY